jgi:hypothetical protein
MTEQPIICGETIGQQQLCVHEDGSEYCKKIKDFLDGKNNDKQEYPVQIVRLWDKTWE